MCAVIKLQEFTLSKPDASNVKNIRRKKKKLKILLR